MDRRVTFRWRGRRRRAGTDPSVVREPHPLRGGPKRAVRPGGRMGIGLGGVGAGGSGRGARHGDVASPAPELAALVAPAGLPGEAEEYEEAFRSRGGRWTSRFDGGPVAWSTRHRSHRVRSALAMG